MRNTSLLLLGGAAAGTWFAGACGALTDDDDANTVRVQQGQLAAVEEDETIDYVPDGYLHVPGGALLHKECIHEVPDGAQVNLDHSVFLNGKKIAQFSACGHKGYRFRRKGNDVSNAQAAGSPIPGTGSGWVEASWAYTTQTMFTHMDSGGWTVPPGPTVNDGQLIYFFPSVARAGVSIAQPVLQWGTSPAGGGAFWGMANWLVANHVGVHSTLRTVSAGDFISGSMDLSYNDASTQYWAVWYTDWNQGYTSPGFVGQLPPNAINAAQPAVLEAYNVTQCADFPSGTGSTYFSRPTVYQGNSYHDRNLVNPSWTLYGPSTWGWAGPSCNFGLSATDPTGSTTLYY